MADIQPVSNDGQQTPRPQGKEEASGVKEEILQRVEESRKTEPKKEKNVDKKQLEKDVNELNNLFKDLNVNFKFNLFDGTAVSRVLVVQLQDKETGQTIKVMPAQNFLQFKVHMAKLRGLFLDKKA